MGVACLFHFKSNPVDKNYISKMVSVVFPDSSGDQQVRHLKRYGWHISGTPGKHILDPTQPSPEFNTEEIRRDRRLTAKTFEEIKGLYPFLCASCGVKEGELPPRYGKDPVLLQQGHKDPEKSSADRDNIIPQCQFCNRAYRNYFVFDDQGRVSTVANVQPI